PPQVAAAAALIIASGGLGRHPTPAQITARLQGTATKLGGGGDERLYGGGLLNAAAATAPGGPGAGAGESVSARPGPGQRRRACERLGSTGLARSLDVSEPPEQAAPAPERCDLAIVGAGIVGLAVAREMLARNPRASVCVLEREREIATHQSSHNSGVIHAGVYYLPGSLKARLCVEGSREIYEYCEQRGIATKRCGKLIVARDMSELGRLAELERRGRANGVPGLRRLDATGIHEIEPHA